MKFSFTFSDTFARLQDEFAGSLKGTSQKGFLDDDDYELKFDESGCRLHNYR